jgi:hypothetical protein
MRNSRDRMRPCVTVGVFLVGLILVCQSAMGQTTHLLSTDTARVEAYYPYALDLNNSPSQDSSTRCEPRYRLVFAGLAEMNLYIEAIAMSEGRPYVLWARQVDLAKLEEDAVRRRVQLAAGHDMLWDGCSSVTFPVGISVWMDSTRTWRGFKGLLDIEDLSSDTLNVEIRRSN